MREHCSAQTSQDDVKFVVHGNVLDTMDSPLQQRIRNRNTGNPGGKEYWVCVQWEDVNDVVKGHGPSLLSMVEAAARITGESRDQLLSRKPTEADCHVRIPAGRLAQQLIDDFGCDGTVGNVTIM